MAEDFALLLVLHELVVVILQRVGHHEIHSFVHLHKVLVLVVIRVTLNLVLLFRILDAELRSLLLVLRLLIPALVAVSLSHACLRVLRARSNVVGSQRTVLNLFLVFLLDTANLIDGHATLHQLCHYLLARHTLGVLLDDVVHYLIVGHTRLSPAHGGAHHHAGYESSESFHRHY